MRHSHFRIGLALATALTVAVAAPATAAVASAGAMLDDAAAFDAWQGQGQGRGQGNSGRDDDARGQGRGNSGRGDDARGQGRGNSGRDDDARGQGRGNSGRGNDDARGQGRGNAGRGNDDARGARGRRHDRPDPAELRAHRDRLPEAVRRLSSSDRRGDRIVVGALTRASLRGTNADRFRVQSSDNGWIVRNSRDQVLVDWDDDRDLGHWEMRRLGDRRARENAPAFCRSGAGHPVWGREWCLDKGFGLGVGERSIWSRADVDDVIFRRRPTSDVLDRGSLIDILGDVVFGRLAVQSLVLGYDEPLVGRWVASTDERDAPFVLRISAGDVAVAELVDTNRDDDVDVLFVSQPRW